MNRLSAVVALTAVLIGGIAAAHQTKPAPHKPKGPRIVILPVLVDGGDKADSTGTIARAALMGALSERDFDIVSSIQIQALADSAGVDLSSPESWSPGVFRQLADPFKAKYVLALRIKKTDVATPADTKATASASSTGLLFDLGKSEFVFKDREATSVIEIESKKPEDREPSALRYKAIKDSALKVVEEFVAKFPKLKKVR